MAKVSRSGNTCSVVLRVGFLLAAVAFAFIPALLLCGCAPTGYIRADGIDGLVDAVVERHDKLCSNPEAMKLLGLDPARAESYKRSGTILKQIKDEAKAQTSSPATQSAANAPRCPDEGLWQMPAMPQSGPPGMQVYVACTSRTCWLQNRKHAHPTPGEVLLLEGD